MKKLQLPIFLQEPETLAIFKDIAAAVPKGTKFYIVGGAMRNAMFYYYFKKKLPQRDYDSLIVGDHKKFITNLRKRGFVYGKIRRKTQAVLKKAKFKNAKTLNDFVFLDMHWVKKVDIVQNMKDHASFTINGFAIEVRDLFSSNWRKKVVEMPNAIRDLRRKQLVVNAVDNKHNLFAAMRFMSVGFKQPGKSDVDWLVREFAKSHKKRRKRNLEKLYNYVGGKKKAEKLAKKIGIDLKKLIALNAS
ncbi:MAG: hypothetical protein Q8R15_03200 [Candidatus Micrarchaeota archaeon]|nr:hypothetical protein [Candidatus Micrarchaeota archaeon]